MVDVVASFEAGERLVTVLEPVTTHEVRAALGRSQGELIALVLDPHDVEVLARAVHAPVVALFSKVPSPDEMRDAATGIAAHGVYVHPSFAPALLSVARSALRGPDILEALTERELEIAHLLVRARSTRAIATSLFLSEHTVRNHLSRLYRKLDVATRQEAADVLAVAFAARERDGKRPPTQA